LFRAEGLIRNRMWILQEAVLVRIRRVEVHDGSLPCGASERTTRGLNMSRASLPVDACPTRRQRVALETTHQVLLLLLHSPFCECCRLPRLPSQRHSRYEHKARLIISSSECVPNRLLHGCNWKTITPSSTAIESVWSVPIAQFSISTTFVVLTKYECRASGLPITLVTKKRV
jgi:hypothetical protein